MILQATERVATGGNAAHASRKAGKIPAVMYGHGIESVSVEFDTVPFEKLYAATGDSTLVDLIINDTQPVKVVVQHVQRHPVSDAISHVDLYQVNMKEKMHVEVVLSFIGEADAEKTLGGILIKNRNHIEIKCLPADLPHDISVDISVLATFEDVIRLKDISAPEGVEIIGDPNLSIATVEAPRTEEELAALNEEVVEDVEGVEVEGAAEGEEDSPTADAETAKE